MDWLKEGMHHKSILRSKMVSIRVVQSYLHAMRKLPRDMVVEIVSWLPQPIDTFDMFTRAMCRLLRAATRDETIHCYENIATMCPPQERRQFNHPLREYYRCYQVQPSMESVHEVVARSTALPAHMEATEDHTYLITQCQFDASDD